MRIGILTYHWVSNFGAQLQTLSTYNKVLQSGHKPYIINWIPQDLENAYSIRVSNVQNMAHRGFCEAHFSNITRVCRDKWDIAKEIDDLQIDMVIIGSDAVFSYVPNLCRIYIGRHGVKFIKPLSVNDFPSPFWGDFASLTKRKIKLVAMSASAQNTKYTRIFGKKQKTAFTKALARFDYISVRDVWTQDMISYLSNGQIEVPITPDPVFAFQQNVSPVNENFVERHLGIKGQYVLITLNNKYVNDNWIQELEYRFAKKGITLIGLPQTDKKYVLNLKYNVSFPLDPISWYNLIRESTGYIGELMHPVLVSLHNSIPVYVFDAYGYRTKHTLDIKSSKTYQIMDRFGLLNNYYNSLYSAKYPEVDYVVNQILGFNREECSIHSKEMYRDYQIMMSNIFLL